MKPICENPFFQVKGLRPQHFVTSILVMKIRLHNPIITTAIHFQDVDLAAPRPGNRTTYFIDVGTILVPFLEVLEGHGTTLRDKVTKKAS